MAASEKQVLEILRGLSGVSVLTVGDRAGFARKGGIINFVLDNGRVRFEINVKAAERAHLKISARFLTVAKGIVAENAGNQMNVLRDMSIRRKLTVIILSITAVSLLLACA